MFINTTIIVILLGIFALLLVLLIMDFLKFRSIKKTIEQKNIPENLSNDKYYELKWRINTLLSLGTIIGVMLGYLGLDIQNELASRFKDYKEKTGHLDTLITILDGKIKAIDSLSNRIKSDFTDQIKKVDSFKSELATLQSGIKKDIKEIQDENLRQSQIYIVTGIPITIVGKKEAEQKIYYKDLKSNAGQELPKFSKAPVIQILINEKDGEILKILENTKDYFMFTYDNPVLLSIEGGTLGKEKEKTNTFDILISNQ
jgi:hypothetical protein